MKITYSNFYKALFFLIILFYCLVLSQFGFENFDTGYIPSFSWRIVNGQSVYQDFIYKGPPVTLYFHAFFMKFLPETGQFFLIRIINYCLFSFQVFLTVSAFHNFYDLSKSRVNKWAIMSVCFIISLLNFSPFPWPTTDGLLFASIAFWLVSKYDKPTFFHLFIIAFFSVLSALTKQSFYLVPLFFLFFVLVKYGLKSALFFLAQLILGVALYIVFILSITDFNNFVQQTTGETHLHDLFYSGIHNYIFIPIVWFLFSMLIVSTIVYLYLKKTNQKIIVFLAVIKWLSVIYFAVALILCLFKEIEIASRIAFDASVIALLYAYAFSKKNLLLITPVLVSLGIAWSSSISFGYPFPILFATGIILSFVVLVLKELRINPKFYFWIAFPICIIAFSYNLRPYREANIFTLTHSLESVSPKLKYIKTSKSSFDKYSDLKGLVAKYGENFIVAPSLPIANYLFNNESELPADWIIETEVNRRQKEFITLAADKKNFIFLEKSFLNHEEFVKDNLEDFSSIAVFIHNKFNLIDETEHFLIYNSIKKDERLP